MRIVYCLNAICYGGGIERVTIAKANALADIPEAMSAGLPVVSYDCPCSPRGIISDGDDGFLVDAGDEVALGDRLCWLIEHPDERKLMGSKAIAKASHYSLEAVAEKWMSLFRELR